MRCFRKNTCFKLACALHDSAQNELEELFGHTPSPVASLKNKPLVAQRAPGKVFDSAFALLYVDPKGNHETSVVAALRAARSRLETPSSRFLKANRALWEQALPLVQRCDSISVVVEYLFVLFYAKKYDEVLEKTDSILAQISVDTDILPGDVCAMVRAVALNLVARHEVKRELSSKRLVGYFHFLKRANELCANKTIRHDLLLALQTAIWAGEWFLYQADTREKHLWDALRQVTPPWFIGLHTLSPGEEAKTTFTKEKKNTYSPAYIHVSCSEAVRSGDVAFLKELLDAVAVREKHSPDFAIFSLSVEIAQQLLHLLPPGDAAVGRVMRWLGSSLDVKTVELHGKGHSQLVVGALQQMQGPAAYYCLHSVLGQQPHRLCSVQERHGDVLLGDESLNWSTALSSLQSSIAADETHWRERLPLVLRLLSDAGKYNAFFDLLREYNCENSRGDNLCVAYSLSRAITARNQWWRALDVVHLLGESAVPQNPTDHTFLRLLCENLGSLLARNHRWKETLLLLDLFQTQKDSPRIQQSLDTIRRQFPQHYTGIEPVTERDWRELLRSKDHFKDRDALFWMNYLNSLSHCKLEDCAALSEIPQELLSQRKVMERALAVVEQNGWLGPFARLLEQADQSTLVKDCTTWINVLLGNHMEKRVVCSSYSVFKKYCSVSSGRKYTVLFPTRLQNMTRQFIASNTGFPLTRIKEKKGRGGRIFSLILHGEQEGHTVGASAVLFQSHRLVALVKPAGADTITFANRCLRQQKLFSHYKPIYVLDPLSTGVVVLVRCGEALRKYGANVYFEAYLAPLNEIPTPLLSTSFSSHYQLSFLDSAAPALLVKGRCNVDDLTGDCLTQLEKDINAEGWGFAESSSTLRYSLRIRKVEMLGGGRDNTVVRAFSC
ncbi:hypothetical protein ADEAN_000615000 [Angomonas deanei]|uniref:Uncharacterized protein n=1 Tax=Angomonas deanei TaxID=59799 RepID=A0A7G2CGN0_9TRYP|nr:hypothetical protein ADEAN_000615000 [Angomonas deanei]